MQLTRDHWTPEDMAQFVAYLATLGKGEEKARWEQRILQTAMPTLAVPATEVKHIVRQIAKGNLREFIALWPWHNYTVTAILGQLLCRLPFAEAEPLLLRYAALTDTWAGTDCLTFTRADHATYMGFARRALEDNAHTFVRRLGVIVMLKVLGDDTVEEILSILPSLESETEYYVNMAVAWLVSECYVHYPEPTLRFLEEGHYNAFVAAKAVSKCRDSYRVSPEDKQMLLRYRRK